MFSRHLPTFILVPLACSLAVSRLWCCFFPRRRRLPKRRPPPGASAPAAPQENEKQLNPPFLPPASSAQPNQNLQLELASMLRSGDLAKLWAVAASTDLRLNLVTVVGCCSLMAAAGLGAWLLQTRPVYLVEFTVHRPPDSWKISMDQHVRCTKAMGVSFFVVLLACRGAGARARALSLFLILFLLCFCPRKNNLCTCTHN
jgi:hypothetical protein